MSILLCTGGRKVNKRYIFYIDSGYIKVDCVCKCCSLMRILESIQHYKLNDYHHCPNKNMSTSKQIST